MALSYRQVLERYDRAKAFGGEQRSLAEYAKGLNELYQTDEFSEGLRDGLWTRASNRIDEFIEGSVLGQASEAVGYGVGSWFGQGEAGAQVGRALPRSILETAPAFLGPLGIGVAALASGAHTYADTGSLGAGAITGGATALMPGASKVAGNIAARFAGAGKLAGQLGDDFVSLTLPKTAADVNKVELARLGGSQAAQFAGNVGQLYGVDRVMGGDTPISELLMSPEFLIEQIPFTAFDLVKSKADFKKAATVEGMRPFVKEIKAPVTEAPTPIVSPVMKSVEDAERMRKLHEVMEKTLSSETATPEQKSEALGNLIRAVNEGMPEPKLTPEVLPTDLTEQSPFNVDDPQMRLQKQDNSFKKFLPTPVEDLATVPNVEGDVFDKVQPKPLETEDIVKIKAPALINPDGTIHEGLLGQTHADVMVEAAKNNIDLSEATQGFVDTKGNVLTREQAFSVADVANQLSPFALGKTIKELHTQDLLPEDAGPEILSQVNEVRQNLIKLQKAQETLNLARERANAVPTRSEEVVELVDLKESTKIAEKLEEGASPAQAALSGQLMTQTKIVDEALADANAAKAKVTKDWNNKQQNKYESVKGVGGARVGGFPTRAEAEEALVEFRESNPQELRPIVVRDAGSRNGKHRGFYLAYVQNATASIDASVGADGTATLGDYLATPAKDTSPLFEVDSVSSDEDLASSLRRAKESAELFSELIDKDGDLNGTITSINQAEVYFRMAEGGQLELAAVNAELKKAGIPEFASQKEMRETMLNMIHGLRRFNRSLHSFHLESSMPFDETVIAQTRIREGAQALTAWIGEHLSAVPEFNLVADLVKSYVNIPDTFNNLRIIAPGDKGHIPGHGFVYYPDALSPTIHVEYLPDAENVTKWALEMAHEITHHMERNLRRRNDPAALEYKATRTRVLEAVRNSPQIPKEVRELVKIAVRDKHYDRFSQGDWSSVKDVWDKHTKGDAKLKKLAYGLLNEDELVATMFNSPELIRYMRTTKMSEGKGVVRTVLDHLSAAWNRLWNGKPEADSALAQLLSSYDNYLTGGVLKNTYNGADFIRKSLLNEGVRPEAMASRMKTIDRLFVKGDIRESIAGFVREAENQLLPAAMQGEGIAQTVRTALVSGGPNDVGKSVDALLAHEVPVHQDLWYRMQEDVKIVEKLQKEVASGKVAGELPESALQNLGAAKNKLVAMKRQLNKQANAIERFNNLQGLSPEGWAENVGAGLFGRRQPSMPDDFADAGEVRKLVGIERLEKGSGASNWLWKNLALTMHFKEKFVEAKAVIESTFDEMGRANLRAIMLNGAYVFDPGSDAQQGKLSKEVQKTLERVASSPAMVEAYSDLARWQNKEGAGKGLNLRDQFVDKTLKRFQPKDREAILTALNQNVQRHKVWADKILPEELGRMNIEYTGAVIAARETGMKPVVARQLAHELYDALAKAVDPSLSSVGIQELSLLSSKMNNDTYMAALKHAQTLSQKTVGWIKSIQEKPAFITEQRYGKDHLVMAGPNGEAFRTSGDREALLKKRDEMQKRGYEFLDYVPAEDANAPRFGIRENLLQALEELDQQNEQLVRELLKDKPDVLAQVLPRIQRTSDVRTSLEAASPLPKVNRKFVGGREDINMMDNANQFYARMNNWIRNRVTRARTNLEMMDPLVEGNREMKQFLNQHVENFLTPDNPIARKMVEATYFAKLGGDLGNAVLEGTQNLTTGMSQLIAETGFVGDAFGLWSSSIKAIGAKLKNGQWANPEHQELMNVAENYGWVGLTTWADIKDLDTEIVQSTNRGVLGKGWDSVSKFIRRPSMEVIKFNDRISLIAAYDLGRSRGMDKMQAIQYAGDVKRRALFTGGKAQRPVGLWSIKTKPVPQLMSALQTYSLGWFGQMADNYNKGFGKNPPKGLTPLQIQGAKKAFLYSIAAQAVLAGALGLPGVGQGIALLEQTTGVDLKGWLKQNLAKMFNEDQDEGGLFSSLALRGFGAAALPFDPSSRASISVPFLPVNSYEGFSLQQLGGATIATAGDFVEGLVGSLRGDRTIAEKMLPNVLKRPVRLWMDEGDVRDKRGGLMQTLTPLEVGLTAIGLPPSRVQAARDTSEAVRKLDEKALRQKQQLVDELASMVRHGKTAEVQLRLQQLHTEQPDLDIRSLVQTIAKRVEAQTVPYDYRRDLNVGVDIEGLSNRKPSSELQRHETRQAVSTSLGVRSTMNQQAFRRAQELDLLMDSNPYMSRSEALMQTQQAAKARNIQRRNSAIAWPEFQ